MSKRVFGFLAVLFVFFFVVSFSGDTLFGREESPRKRYKRLKAEYSRTEDDAARLTYFNLIAEIDYKDVAEFVQLVAINDPSFNIRKAALSKYDCIEDPHLVASVLRRALLSASPTEREYYQFAIKRFPPKRFADTIDKLGNFLRGRTSKKTLSIICQRNFSKKLNYYMRFTAAEALARLSHIKTFKILLAGLGDKNWETRTAAARGIGLARYAPGLDTLELCYLKEKNVDVRVELIVAMGRISNGRAIAALEDIEVRTDDDPELAFVREAIEIARANKDAKGKLVAGKDGYAHYERTPDAKLRDFEFGVEHYFLFDSTLSMAHAKENIKAQIVSFITTASPKDRIAVVAHRDLNNRYLFEDSTITYDRRRTSDFIAKLGFSGANRTNILLMEGLMLVGIMPSQFRLDGGTVEKHVYIFGDTPPREFENVLRVIRLMRTVDGYDFSACDCWNAIQKSKVEKYYRRLAAVGGGEYHDIREFDPPEDEDDDSGDWQPPH